MKKPGPPKKPTGPKLPTGTTYEVGYGKPPVETQFKPGQRANPGGRPKGSKSKPRGPEGFYEMVLKEGDRKIRITEGTRSLKAPVIQVALRSIGVEAMKGNHKAQRHQTELYYAAKYAREQAGIEMFNAYLDYKNRTQEELDRRERLGITGREIIPHPDQIIIDPRTGVCGSIGPLTKEERDESFRWYEESRTEWRELVAQITDRLAAAILQLDVETDGKIRKRLTKLIKQDENLIPRLKARAEDHCQKLLPWGFKETRPLWEPE